jgi:crotonobetainyl-CoA:carnitine CoA-transferase CaiB-like acyl-CoA transferase
VTAQPPLAGVRVISLAEQYPGPFATMLLADLGADVVLVERPGTGDPTRGYPGFFDSMARGKRSVVIDLKTDSGRSALWDVIESADVLLEGFRPGTLERLGFSSASVRQRHPRLLYVSISGYGQTGPNRLRSGHDLTYQAEAGVLYEHAPPAPPPTPPALALGDLSAAMFAVQGVLAGLLRRERTGLGGDVDVAMVDCLSTMLAAHVGPVTNMTGPPGFPYEPGYGVFVTADGEYLALGIAHEDHFWRALCDVTGLDSERELGTFARLAAHSRLRERLANAIARHAAPHWEQVLGAVDVPYGRVRRLHDLPGTAQSVARKIFTTPDGPTGAVHVRQPLVFDGAAPGPRRGVPGLGEHAAELLRECGATGDHTAGPTDTPAGTRT